jgi:hypothetical protein
MLNATGGTLRPDANHNQVKFQPIRDNPIEVIRYRIWPGVAALTCGQGAGLKGPG